MILDDLEPGQTAWVHLDALHLHLDGKAYLDCQANVWGKIPRGSRREEWGAVTRNGNLWSVKVPHGWSTVTREYGGGLYVAVDEIVVGKKLAPRRKKRAAGSFGVGSKSAAVRTPQTSQVIQDMFGRTVEAVVEGVDKDELRKWVESEDPPKLEHLDLSKKPKR